MKTKKHEKKLKLNKTTIATLNPIEMSAALGGAVCPPPSDPPELCTTKTTQIETQPETTSCPSVSPC